MTSAAGVDWDNDAGEAWVRVVVESAVVAYVSTEMPLAIIVAGLAETSELAPPVQSIVG